MNSSISLSYVYVVDLSSMLSTSSQLSFSFTSCLLSCSSIGDKPTALGHRYFLCFNKFCFKVNDFPQFLQYIVSETVESSYSSSCFCLVTGLLPPPLRGNCPAGGTGHPFFLALPAENLNIPPGMQPYNDNYGLNSSTICT